MKDLLDNSKDSQHILLHIPPTFYLLPSFCHINTPTNQPMRKHYLNMHHLTPPPKHNHHSLPPWVVDSLIHTIQLTHRYFSNPLTSPTNFQKYHPTPHTWKRYTIWLLRPCFLQSKESPRSSSHNEPQPPSQSHKWAQKIYYNYYLNYDDRSMDMINPLQHTNITP